VTTLLARRSQVHQQVLTSHLTPYDAAYREALAHTAALVQQHGASAPDAAAQAGGLIYGGMLRQAGMLAFSDAFRVMAILFLAIVPLMFLMKRSGPLKGPVVVD